MICGKAHGISIPEGGRDRHRGVPVPDQIGLKFFQGQDLALGVDGKKRHILIRSYIKAQDFGLILYRLDGGTAVRRGKHIGARKTRFSFSIVLMFRPFLIKPRRDSGPGVG